VGRESYVEALDLLNQAIQRDSRYAPALALAASCRSSLDVAGWIGDAGANRDEALGLTRRALAAARDDPNVLAYGAYVLAYFGEDIIAAIALIDRCLELNPSFAVVQSGLTGGSTQRQGDSACAGDGQDGDAKPSADDFPAYQIRRQLTAPQGQA
jgi:tetratricopeptide (TPR) repeat protein